MVKPIQNAPPSARRGRGETTLLKLRRDILLGRYRAGSRLPPERELATRLGTNRNTLREALRILEAEHLVRARQGDGTLVLDWRSTAEITLLPAFLTEDTPAEERFEAVRTLLNLRERLLEEVLNRACLLATDDDYEAVHDAITQLAEARPHEVVTADIEVYRRFAIASHSVVTVWTFNTFAKIFSELGERFPALWQRDAAYVDGLTRMLKWIREKRPERAREEMRLVFEERGMALLQLLRPDESMEREKPRGKSRGARR
jgi:GntR family transcriptional repressor for pyruvate dehydrogenase complex